MTTIYERAILKFGYKNQILKTIEEMAELTVELLHQSINRPAPGIYEEIADVHIMLEQIKVIYGKAHVKEAIEKKLARLENVLSQE